VNPLALVAVAGVAWWIWARLKAATAPPAVTVDPTGAGTPGSGGQSLDRQITETQGDASEANKLGAEGAGLGFSVGMLAFGPLGAVIGAMAGAAIGLMIGALLGSSMDPGGWPWSTWAMPYWPDANTTTTGDDGVERLHVSVVSPALPDGTPSVLAADIGIETAVLRPMFPGNGAYEACLASGMFAWRPREVPTPFSAALYQQCTWLADYEAAVLAAYQAHSEDWGGFIHFIMFDTDYKADFIRSLHLCRRLYAYSMLFGPDVLKVELDTFAATIPNNDPLNFNPAKLKSLDVVQQVARELWGAIDAGPEHVATPVPNIMAAYQTFRGALCGYPGAWCYSSDAPSVTTLSAPLATSAPAATAGRAGALEATHTALTIRNLGPAAAVGVTSKRFRVWLPSFAMDYDGYRLHGTDDATSGIWGQSYVIPLQLFIDSGEYGSEADAVAELESGGLAWGPNSTDRALRAWHLILPQTGTWWANMRRQRRVPCSKPFSYVKTNPATGNTELLDEAHYQQELAWYQQDQATAAEASAAS
jgi:hypothetical protein